MDYLWTPWRFTYITNADKPGSCIFCELPKETDDRKAFIVHRAGHCYVVLNAFPYTSGHVMVVPYAHLDTLAQLPKAAADEMMALTQRMESVLRSVYRPEGVNVGMNIGKAAGAGVAGHIHMHVLPRWTADSNFMTTVSETRVLPEDLAVTWERLTKAFRSV
ncbi:MAG: HIT domain-containing protein [Candidatus Koribacter versatilis]|uniref:HIT domain-containing protein n=1 Tax=Candidatus Korobacter versatilis TaxID=658062 RepID=A0A932EQD0_9BACT|nr:HIT domain-containing protein [Candidatus Koribacter versatilis]